MKDREILRRLAFEYRTLSTLPVNEERRKLHYAVNDLAPIRPVVLMDEIPWHEFDLAPSCQDGFLRDCEMFLKKRIHQFKHFACDMILQPFFPLQKVIHSTGNGMRVAEETRVTDKTNNIISHEYIDQFEKDEDIEKLHKAVITYDEEETMKRYTKLASIFGDILPIRLMGESLFYVTMWDDISRYRGVEALLYDLIDRPEFMVQLCNKITDIKLDILDQYEKLGLLDDMPYSLHCTPCLTHDLPLAEDGKVTRKNIWGRGAAQIFSSVSADMLEEFDLPDMFRTIGECGLSYYGCCEALDQKLEVVTQIKNLRKVGVSPWAKKEVCMEYLTDKYVSSVKTQPAFVAVSSLDHDLVRKEIREIVDLSKKYNAPVDITLKDISTCGRNPQNLDDWAKIAMEEVDR